MASNKNSLLTKILSIENLQIIVLITTCFMLWGFSNNVTTSTVGMFSKIFRISTTEASLVPVIFGVGYFCMAFPAALFIQKYSYKWGVVMGLGLFAAGTLLFFPAKWTGDFYPFLGAYFILTCGLSMLETSCNPLMYSLGEEKGGIQRLNGAQAFNALGVIIGMMFVLDIQKHLSPVDNEIREVLPLGTFNVIKMHDLGVMIQPYVFIGAIVLLIMVIAILMKSTKEIDIPTEKSAMTMLRELKQRRNYREGVMTEFCYIGAQIGCWTYMVQYAVRVLTEEGLMEQHAELAAEKYLILAMAWFAFARFFCTWLMHWLNPSRMLSVLGILSLMAMLGGVVFTDRNGIYSIMIACGCFSMMFPTIYGLALKGVGEKVKMAGAGLTMSILGGSIFPLIQAAIIQSDISILGIPSTNLSFIVPLLCVSVVVWYGHKTYVRFNITGDDDSAATPSTELARTEEHK